MKLAVELPSPRAIRKVAAMIGRDLLNNRELTKTLKDVWQLS
jgi:hypothetical protein